MTRTSVQPGTPPGRPYGYILASELRTLSRIVEYGDQTGKAQIYLKAYNKLVKTPRLIGQTAEMAIPGLPPGLVPLPIAGADIYQAIEHGKIKTLPGCGFASHPQGHWSCSRAAIAYYDIVQAKGKPARTHKDLFNRAFGQARDYTFYNYADPASGAYDVGGFRTQGVWITF